MVQTQTSQEAETLLQSAVAAFHASDHARAEAQCRRVLALDPGHIDALGLLGLVELSQSRFAEAEPIFDLMCRLQPGQIAHWVNLGTAYRGTGAFDEALSAFVRAAALGENSPNFYYNLGLTHMGRGDLEAACSVFARAQQLAPEDAEIRYRYAQSCLTAIRHEEALAALKGWNPPDGTPAEIVLGIAQVLMTLGEYQLVEPLIARIIHSTQPDPHATFILIQMFERTNRVDEADALLRQLTASPAAVAAVGSDLLLTRGQIAQRQGQHELALEHFRQSLGACAQPQERHFVQFPMAKSLHALKRHAETLQCLSEAHASQVARVQLEMPLVAARGAPQMQITDFSCDPDDVAGWDHRGAPAMEDSPIFVVAFPRSGTTLLELTLDAHPLLRSMDEQPFLQNALEDITALGVGYPEQLGRLTFEQLERIRANYHARVARKVQITPGLRLVDKNPLNMLRLPVIRRVFPNAPILLAIRHPCDVILSCYMQEFRAPDFALLCADLPSIANGYRRTFDFWYQQAALLQPNSMEVRYEQFVADFAAQTQRIATFLRLPWDPAMLDPAQQAHSKRYISTPSYSQVVQPVSSKAVGRWQAYREAFAPVLPIIEPYLQRWDYDGLGSEPRPASD
ncbi:MAG: sulfotransferase [Steroidobacteraceae bacterium]